MTLCIQASLIGDYDFPDDGVLVSGIYWLSLHPHVKKFGEEVTLSLEHCVSVDGDTSALSFITAECTEYKQRHTFKLLPGGSFISRKSTIEVTKFSGFGIIKSYILNMFLQLYTFRVYYIAKRPNEYEVHITVAKDIPLLQKVITINTNILST